MTSARSTRHSTISPAETDGRSDGLRQNFFNCMLILIHDSNAVLFSAEKTLRGKNRYDMPNMQVNPVLILLNTDLLKRLSDLYGVNCRKPTISIKKAEEEFLRHFDFLKLELRGIEPLTP